MSDLHFLQPWWLLGVALCAALAVIGRRQRSAPSPWHQVVEGRLAAVLIRPHASRYAVGPAELLWLLLGLGMLALAGPTWSRQVPDELKEQAAVIIVLGNGPSMYAGDIAPNRNRAAKAKINALRERMPQASFSVIAYADSAHLVIPLTRDAGFFDLFLQPLEPDIMPRVSLPGSGLGQALDLARQTAASATLPANVVVITDNLSDAERTDLLGFHQGFPALEVLVVGTGEGGPLRFAPGNLSTTATKVPLDIFASLKAEGLPVTGLSGDGQDLDWLSQRIRSTLTQAHNGDAQWNWQDAGYWLVLLMLPLGLLLQRQLRVLGVALPIALLVAGYTPDARAGWQDWWWTPDQQGQQALDRKDYAGAAAHFSDPYRKGRAYYLAHDYAQAAAAFAQVKTAEGYFYLGNSLAQRQRYQTALKAYRQALLMDPGLRQASDNANAVKAVLEELAKRPSERQEADPGDNDFSSLRIDLQRPHRKSQDSTARAASMSDDELNHWMANVKSSPRDMLKALFLLQAQQHEGQEAK